MYKYGSALRHNLQFIMVLCYPIINMYMLSILAGYAAAATSKPLSLFSQLDSDALVADGGVVCPTGGYCDYTTPNCCSGT